MTVKSSRRLEGQTTSKELMDDWCEAKPTTLRHPSPGDGFENHMCITEL